MTLVLELYVLNRHLDVFVNAVKSDGKRMVVYYVHADPYVAASVSLSIDSSMSEIHEAIAEDIKERMP